MTENGHMRTRIAVLGTMAEFHNEAILLERSSLLELVATVNPDLLCLDITPKQWHERDFDRLPSEYRQALLPLASQTDIVVAPIGENVAPPNRVLGGWKHLVINWLHNWINLIQCTTPKLTTANLGWRLDLVNYLYYIIQWLSGSNVNREARTHIDNLAQEILALSQRDPNTRILVVVNVQYCYVIQKRLRKCKELNITTCSKL